MSVLLTPGAHAYSCTYHTASGARFCCAAQPYSSKNSFTRTLWAGRSGRVRLQLENMGCDISGQLCSKVALLGGIMV